MPEWRDIENVKKLVALDYPEVTSFRCVEVTIPDDDKYLYALAGFISLLGDAWSYIGDRNDRIYRAARWRMAYSLTTWAACMNCEELQECLQPLFDALRQQVNQDAIFRQYGTENPTGVPLSEEAINADLANASNPECDLDILWAQCLQVIEYSNQLIMDALEIAESAANDMELVEAITQLPVIDELGADAIAGYINLLQEGLAENYAAQYTQEYLDDAACALFCLAKADCAVTLERISQVFKTRVEAHFSTPFGALATISDLFFYFIDLDIDGTIIADVLMLIIWEGGVLTNQLLGDVGTKSLETLLQLAVNDANDDWLILCPDCPNEFEVPATADPFETDGFDTGMDLVTGTEYVITASGLWNGGAGGDVDADGTGTPGGAGFIVPTANVYSLCFKIGAAGTPTFCGTELIFTAPASGRLYMFMNDLETAYINNSGSQTVIVAET